MCQIFLLGMPNFLPVIVGGGGYHKAFIRLCIFIFYKLLFWRWNVSILSLNITVNKTEHVQIKYIKKIAYSHIVLILFVLLLEDYFLFYHIILKDLKISCRVVEPISIISQKVGQNVWWLIVVFRARWLKFINPTAI